MTDTALSPVGRFEHLLLATDGSEYCAGAIRVAGDLARKLGARLTLLSVALYNPETETLEPTLGAEADRQAQASVDAAKAAVGAIECTTHVQRSADPARAIAETAETLRADVIVMGRRGRRGLARWMLGDATARVIGRAPCSVLVVPKAATMWQRRILVATDGSSYGDAAAVSAGRLAGRFGLPLSVVSAVTAGDNAERRQETQTAVDRVQAALGAEGVQVSGELLEGRPDQAILVAAQANGADLIVVGSHGRTGLEKMLMGSTSERILNQADCPVLVVKAA
jgi:universal stress protein E